MQAILTSPYPPEFIPAGATPIVSVDVGSPDGDCTIRGFYKDGELHVQAVEYHPR